MPHKIWTAGEEVVAVDFQSYLQDQVVATFTNAAQRDAALIAPDPGATCYLSGTAELLTFDGAAWRKPWNLPWGIVGYAEKITDTNATSPAVIATIAAVAWPAGRRILVQAHGNGWSPVAGDDFRAYIMDAANAVQYQHHQDTNARVNQNVGLSLTAVVTTTGAPIGFAFKAGRGNGTGAAIIQASAVQPAMIVATDIGPGPGAMPTTGPTKKATKKARKRA